MSTQLHNTRSHERQQTYQACTAAPDNREEQWDKQGKHDSGGLASELDDFDAQLAQQLRNCKEKGRSKLLTRRGRALRRGQGKLTRRSL